MFNKDKYSTLNLGRLFQIILLHLNPVSPNLLQKFRQGKNFNIHNFREMVLFENVPLDKKKVAKTMTSLCMIVNEPRLTNHSIDETAAEILHQFSYNARQILQITGMFSRLVLSMFFLRSIFHKILNFY